MVLKRKFSQLLKGSYPIWEQNYVSFTPDSCFILFLISHTVELLSPLVNQGIYYFSLALFQGFLNEFDERLKQQLQKLHVSVILAKIQDKQSCKNSSSHYCGSVSEVNGRSRRKWEFWCLSWKQNQQMPIFQPSFLPNLNVTEYALHFSQ